MPQKAPSITKSSTSASDLKRSAAAPISRGLETPIQFLKGVGPKLGALLEAKGLRNVRDALFYLPRDYQDRTTLRPISSIKIDETVLIRGKVIGHSYVPMRRLKRPMLEARVQDASGGVVGVKWFQYNRTYMDEKLRAQPTLVAYGTVKAFSGRLGMIHPEIDWDVDAAESVTNERIHPIYSESDGLTQKTIRKILMQAMGLGLSHLRDDLPTDVMAKHQLMPIKDAILRLHEPLKTARIEDLQRYNTPEQRRLIFDELFKFEWIIGRKRLNMRREYSKPYPAAAARPLIAGVLRRLPFEMTDDQIAGVDKIHGDISEDKPMNRLLQGDVGCGKTLVALCSALPVVAGGGQCAIMAPTEILAEQHLQNARRYIDGLALPQGGMLNVALLTGSTTKSQREEILSKLAAGQIHVLIGTHALIEDPVRFNELGLVIIDEQHRFGVDQRLRLRGKGKNPHTLALTATPIPRTLALTAYGDLDVTIIRQMPKGRPEVYTKIVKPEGKPDMLAHLRTELEKGRQAYIIYPLVEESEKIDLANAVQGAEELANGALSGYRVGLLHGRLKSQEKADVMNRFKKGEIQALVSTTVVEVGVDVPNATVLVIENAERFGLSQLHQLRGRIGRGTETSYCFLFTASSGENSFERLKAMEETRDGFKLAELDLEIRGPGEFLGTRQSGDLDFKYANLVRDQLILHETRASAFEIIKTDPELERPENAPLRAYMEKTGALKERRFGTA